MDAVKIVLDATNLDDEYILGDIGWKFWKTEGDPLPARTIKPLKETDYGLFGAITSKPNDEAQKELAPELKNKGFIYSSSIVGLRQTFNLHTNLRPCRVFAGNPLNYRDDIDLIVFRENTEGLHDGVEFQPVPDEIFNACMSHKKMKKFENVPLDDMVISTRIFTRETCQNIVRQAFKYENEHNPQKCNSC